MNYRQAQRQYENNERLYIQWYAERLLTIKEVLHLHRHNTERFVNALHR